MRKINFAKKILLLLVATIVLVIGFIGFLWLTTPTDTERTETVFVYATLTNPIIRTLTCQCLTNLTPATLSQYEQINRTIVPNQTENVSGGLISVTPSELRRLDRYERVPTRYTREVVQVHNQPVWVYIKNE